MSELRSRLPWFVLVCLVLAGTAVAWRHERTASAAGSGDLFLPLLLRAEPPNRPPETPRLLAPLSGADHLCRPTTLHWAGGDPDGDALTFAVYLEANVAPPTTLVADDLPLASYPLGSPAPDALYYWQIVAQDEHGATTTGPVWGFRTGQPGDLLCDMAQVPAGEFRMGCDETNPVEACFAVFGDWEVPPHTVYLDAYYIDRYEVTNGQYAACVTAGACTAPSANSSYTRPSYYDNPAYADYPVLRVTWNDATAYCAWAGKRLPTEAEWEKAARGADNIRKFPWGDEAPDCARLNYSAAQNQFCVGDTTAVGSYPTGNSPYGLFDMGGNLWEWVNDWFQADYYSVSPYANPTGPATGTNKVVRGGSWVELYWLVRVAARASSLPQTNGVTYGFRCAVAP